MKKKTIVVIPDILATKSTLYAQLSMNQKFNQTATLQKSTFVEWTSKSVVGTIWEFVVSSQYPECNMREHNIQSIFTKCHNSDIPVKSRISLRRELLKHFRLPCLWTLWLKRTWCLLDCFIEVVSRSFS